MISISLLVVLEEPPDKFKKGNEQSFHFNARENGGESGCVDKRRTFSPEGVKLWEKDWDSSLLAVTSNVPATKVWESFPYQETGSSDSRGN